MLCSIQDTECKTRSSCIFGFSQRPLQCSRRNPISCQPAASCESKAAADIWGHGELTRKLSVFFFFWLWECHSKLSISLKRTTLGQSEYILVFKYCYKHQSSPLWQICSLKMWKVKCHYKEVTPVETNRLMHAAISLSWMFAVDLNHWIVLCWGHWQDVREERGGE